MARDAERTGEDQRSKSSGDEERRLLGVGAGGEGGGLQKVKADEEERHAERRGEGGGVRSGGANEEAAISRVGLPSLHSPVDIHP